jgi:hypothetical protein
MLSRKGRILFRTPPRPLSALCTRVYTPSHALSRMIAQDTVVRQYLPLFQRRKDTVLTLSDHSRFNEGVGSALVWWSEVGG